MQFERLFFSKKHSLACFRVYFLSFWFSWKLVQVFFLIARKAKTIVPLEICVMQQVVGEVFQCELFKRWAYPAGYEIAPKFYVRCSKTFARTSNCSFQGGGIPNGWGCTAAVPLDQGGPNNIMENFKSVSFTSIFCRVTEKLVRARVCNICNIQCTARISAASWRICPVSLTSCARSLDADK